MKNTNTTTVQEMATFLRNLAYGDNQKHGIDWCLHVIHPKTNDGCVGYSGGLWHRNKQEDRVSINFSFDKINGVYHFGLWKDRCEIRLAFGDKPSFDEFKKVCVEQFKIEKLYE